MQIIRPRDDNKEFLHGLPKAELHVHLEGAIEPELAVELSNKNDLKEFRPQNAEEVRVLMGEARDLPTFIKVYEQILSVLCTEDDFYLVTITYLKRVSKQGVVYVEMFFDPQAHTSRGISFETIMKGIKRAKEEALTFKLKCSFIMCFHRDRSVDSAFEHLTLAIPFRDIVIGVGTDNLEHSGFPNDFKPVFEKAAKLGFRLTSHCDAGFKTSVDNIRGCLDLLNVQRIDHGVNVLDDEQLVSQARDKQIGFTVCPTFFYTPAKGQINKGYAERCADAAMEMINAGLCVTLASDDPGVMVGQYIGDVYYNVCSMLFLLKEQMVPFARNGFKMAWITEEERQVYLSEIDVFVQKFVVS